MIADVEVEGLGDYFVGERTRVYVATGTREALVIPEGFVYRRFGVSYVKLKDGTEVVVQVWPSRRRRAGNPRGPSRRRRGDHAMKLGISGHLTRASITSPLTPLLLLAALIVGSLALLGLPREEEPQISVPMVDIMVTANGYKAGDAIELITKPLEDIVKAINGVEHVYSTTQDNSVVTTARFFVGTDEDTALLRVHEKIRANIADLPKGIPEPIIIGRGINDVAIVTLTLEPKPGSRRPLGRQWALPDRPGAAA